MRDLLTDLVRRTRRPESTVQPRLPSAFESSAPTMPDLVIDEEVVTQVPAASPRPSSTPEHTHPPATRWAREPHDSPAIVTTVMRTAPQAPTHPVDHSPHERAAASAPSEVVARTTTPGTPATAPGRLPAVVVASARATSLPVPPVDVAARDLRARVSAAIQPATRSEPPTMRPVRVEPPREGPADAGKQRAPEIRISIGRIDVRATAAERPPARRQPSSAPPLTLDEYLAARARRGSR